MIISAFAFGGIPEKAVEKAFIETEILAFEEGLRRAKKRLGEKT